MELEEGKKDPILSKIIPLQRKLNYIAIYTELQSNHNSSDVAFIPPQCDL